MEAATPPEDATPSTADTAPSQLSKDPTLRRIQLQTYRAQMEQAFADARTAAATADKTEADAQTAEQTANFPPSTFTPREGKLEVGANVGLVSDLIAHKLLDDAAERIVHEIEGGLQHARVLLVFDPNLVASDWPYKSVSTEIERATNELQAVCNELKSAWSSAQGRDGDTPGAPTELSPEEIEELVQRGQGVMADLGIGLAVGAGESVAGGLATLASMFRSDYSLTARSVSIGQVPLAAATAHRLTKRASEVAIENFNLLENSNLLDEFGHVVEHRHEVERELNRVNKGIVEPADRDLSDQKDAASNLRAALGKDGVSKENLADLFKAKADADGAAVKAKSSAVNEARAAAAVAADALTRFDAFVTAVTQAPATGYPPLIVAALRERLHGSDEKYTQKYTHVLYVGIESAGGETLTRAGIFRTTVRFVGGAQVSYLLLDVGESRLVAANTAPVLGEMEFKLRQGAAGDLSRLNLGERTRTASATAQRHRVS
jgi:hypothetical protein